MKHRFKTRLCWSVNGYSLGLEWHSLDNTLTSLSLNQGSDCKGQISLSLTNWWLHHDDGDDDYPLLWLPDDYWRCVCSMGMTAVLQWTGHVTAPWPKRWRHHPVPPLSLGVSLVASPAHWTPADLVSGHGHCHNQPFTTTWWLETFLASGSS